MGLLHNFFDTLEEVQHGFRFEKNFESIPGCS